MLRDKRRTAVITMISTTTNDTIRACEPECRNYVLSDLGIPSGGQWKYKPAGEADVTAAWSGRDYHVSWKRCKPSAIYCDQCGDEWQTRIPALIADAQRRSEARKGIMPPAFAPFLANRAALTPSWQ